MQEISKSIPVIGQAAPDLVVKFSDVPGAQELADRLKKTVPPNLIDDPKQKQAPIPPQVQAQIQAQMQQMQQMDQMVQQLTEKLNELQQEKEMKLIELQSKERIEMAKLETQAQIEFAKLDAKDSIILLQSQIAELDARQRQLGSQMPFQMDGQSMGSGAMQAPMEPEDMGGDPQMMPPQDLPIDQPGGAYPGAEFGDGGLDPAGEGFTPEQPSEGDYQ